MPPSKIFESWRGCTGGGDSPPSEKLIHLFECEQSEYEQDEIALLPRALNPLFFGVALRDVFEAGIDREY